MMARKSELDEAFDNLVPVVLCGGAGFVFALMAGPVALGIAALVFVALYFTGRLSLCFLPVLIGGFLAYFSDFFDQFWAQRWARLGNEFRFGNLFESYGWGRGWSDPLSSFLADMFALELVAAGFLAGGVLGIGYWCYLRSTPARRAYLSARRRKHGVQAGWLVKRLAKRVSDGPAGVKAGAVLGVGLETFKRLLVPLRSLNSHMLVCGTTNAGKTVTVGNVVEAFIMAGKPVIYIDGKGDPDLGEKVIGLARSEGVPVWRFAMYGESCNYNPLASGDYTSKKDRIIELREWSESYYRTLAEGYLQMVFKVLDAVGETTDLVNVTNYLDRDSLAKLVRAHEDKLKAATVKALKQEIAEQEEAEDAVEGIRADLRNLARSKLGPLFDTSGSDVVVDDEDSAGAQLPQSETMILKDVIASGGVAYISLLPVHYPALADTLGKLVINDVKASMDPKTRKDVLLVVDEFTTLAGPQVLNVLNQTRSMGVHGIVTIQGLSDLGQKISKNARLFMEQIVQNCNVYAIHRLNSPSDAEWLAKIIGKRWQVEISSQLDEIGATGKGSAREVQKYLVDPDEIQTLEQGHAVFVDKNTKTVVRFLSRLGRLF